MSDCVALPQLMAPAPEFEAFTTQGKKKLSDYRGKWVILFSHPADFTPVCTTEFMAFTELNDEFEKHNVQLIGLSIDSVWSHIAWVRNIKEKTGVQIPFPIIADLSMDVAKKYGMIHPGADNTSTIRCVFIIDPDGILRCMLYYPMQVGRNMLEIIRIIKALQTADKHGVVIPANWQPGNPVLRKPPLNVDAANVSADSPEGEVVDWYLTKIKVD